MGIASMVLGIISAAGTLLTVGGPTVAIPAGVAGLVLGIIALAKRQQRGMALAGVILSGAGILMAVGFVIYWLAGGIRI